MISKFSALLGLCALFLVLASCPTQAAMQVDIYGPGQNILNLAIATPLGPNAQAVTGLGAELDKTIRQNLSFLPFMRITDPAAILGGTVLAGYASPAVDFKRFQLASADLLITEGWPKGDAPGSTVELRAYETYSGNLIFAKAYGSVTQDKLPEVADRFCADLMEKLSGNGDFFRSTLAVIKPSGKFKSDVWLVKPTGRDLRQITRIPGEALSPSWSPDGRFVVFSHLDDRTHALGVWDRLTNQVQRIRFPGNTVIGPSFLPNNKVAVSLTSGRNPDIFLLDHTFKRERPLEENASINVSPTFDATGTKMAFCSSRMGGPQIFIKDLRTGTVTRASRQGNYNTEPSISPDGSLVAFSRLTDSGHRIFVQDMVTGQERQVTFGPGNDILPAFAPDSYFLAFTSTRAGGKKVYLITRHGGEPKMVPTGSGDASFARWGKIPK